MTEQTGFPPEPADPAADHPEATSGSGEDVSRETPQPVHHFQVTHHQEAEPGGARHQFTTDLLDAEKAIEFIRSIVTGS